MKKVWTEKELDSALRTESQKAVARLVHELPEDVLSLSWRSDLNQKLRFAAAKIDRKRKIHAWIVRPSLGLGLAAAMASVVFFRPQPLATASSEPEVASAIVRTFNEDLNAGQVSAEYSFESKDKETATSTLDPYSEDFTEPA